MANPMLKIQLEASDPTTVEILHLKILLELKTIEAEAWKTMVYLVPDKAQAQLLAERDAARRELAELRTAWNETRPQLLLAERNLEIAEGELRVLRERAKQAAGTAQPIDYRAAEEALRTTLAHIPPESEGARK